MPNRAVRIVKRRGGGGGLVPPSATIFLHDISPRRYVWVGEIWEEGRCMWMGGREIGRRGGVWVGEIERRGGVGGWERFGSRGGVCWWGRFGRRGGVCVGGEIWEDGR